MPTRGWPPTSPGSGQRVRACCSLVSSAAWRYDFQDCRPEACFRMFWLGLQIAVAAVGYLDRAQSELLVPREWLPEQEAQAERPCREQPRMPEAHEQG